MTSRDFNQNTSGAKRASRDGPVVITERGRPTHVLLRYEEYERLAVRGRTIIDALAMPEGADIEFEIPKLNWTPRDVDLS